MPERLVSRYDGTRRGGRGSRGQNGEEEGPGDSGRKPAGAREPGKPGRPARRARAGQPDNLLCCQYVAHNDRLLDFSDTAIIVAADLGRSSLA